MGTSGAIILIAVVVALIVIVVIGWAADKLWRRR